MSRERGVATLGACIVAVVIVLAGIIGWQATQLIALGARASGAADLAALAGSQASLGGEAGCPAARRVAEANGARLVHCRMDADVATVTARAESARWWGGRWAAERRARAAPLSYLEP